MKELFNLGLGEKTVSHMLEFNLNLKEVTNIEILEKIQLLKDINCSDNQILNIISSNSLYLSRTNTDIVKLIEYLLGLGFNILNILFDSNPYILNLDTFEIEEYINKRKNNGESLEDIIDDLDSNPYIFNEL